MTSGESSGSGTPRAVASGGGDGEGVAAARPTEDSAAAGLASGGGDYGGESSALLGSRVLGRTECSQRTLICLSFFFQMSELYLKRLQRAYWLPIR